MPRFFTKFFSFRRCWQISKLLREGRMGRMPSIACKGSTGMFSNSYVMTSTFSAKIFNESMLSNSAQVWCAAVCIAEGFSSGANMWQGYPKFFAARESIQPNWPPPRMPIVPPAGNITILPKESREPTPSGVHASHPSASINPDPPAQLSSMPATPHSLLPHRR